MIDEFTLKKEKHIEHIINNFNFDTVCSTMKFLDWTWYGSNDTPKIEELIDTAKDLLNQVYELSYSDTISTGGFKATRFEDYLELEFMVDSYSSEMINYGSEFTKIKKQKTLKKKINTIKKLIEDEND